MAASDDGLLACLLFDACQDLSRLDDKYDYKTLAIQYNIRVIKSVNDSLLDNITRASDNTIIKVMTMGSDAVRCCLSTNLFVFIVRSHG